MSSKKCPFCSEEIQAEASFCRYCQKKVTRTRAEAIVAAVTAAYPAAAVVPLDINRNPSDCQVWCAYAYKGDKAGRKQCEDDCKAAALIASVYARFHQDFHKSFIELIWEKGNIDPVPELLKGLQSSATAALQGLAKGVGA